MPLACLLCSPSSSGLPPAPQESGSQLPPSCCPTYPHPPQQLRYHKRCPSSWPRSHHLCSGSCYPCLSLEFGLVSHLPLFLLTSGFSARWYLYRQSMNLGREEGKKGEMGGKTILPEDQPSIHLLPVFYSTLCACPFSSIQLLRPLQLGFCPLVFSKCSSLLSASLFFHSQPC